MLCAGVVNTNAVYNTFLHLQQINEIYVSKREAQSLLQIFCALPIIFIPCASLLNTSFRT